MSTSEKSPPAHPNVHAPWRAWSEDQTLYVAAVYANPLRWRSRRHLVNDFRQRMEQAGNVRLYLVEIAFGDRPFEVTSPDNPTDLQLRTDTEVWQKERALNLAVQRFPASWRYGAWVDADVSFSRHDWALETVHQLQHYAWVQPFSSAADLSAEQRPFLLRPSFAWAFHHGAPLPSDGYYGPKGAGCTGYAWAFRRAAFNTVGGLLDIGIAGSGDWHMAFGLAGLDNWSVELKACPRAYVETIADWCERAKALTANVGYVECHLLHHFHGNRVRRGYEERWKILRDHAFDPRSDIFPDWQGLWQLTTRKPALRDAIRRYLRARHEDDPCLNEREAHLV